MNQTKDLPGSETAGVRPLTFRVGPEYRRCAVYFVLGWWAVQVTANWVRGNFPWQGWQWAVNVTLMLVPVALMVPVFRWRLRIDEHGINRRGLIENDFWPWEAFQNGWVHPGISYGTYQWPDLPWWRRSLILDFLPETDRHAVVKAIRHFFVPPPAPEHPPEITVRYGFRRRARFAADGLWFGKRDDPRPYAWTDVQRLTITRIEHDRHDFRRLELVLPDQVITFRVSIQNGAPVANFAGARAEEVAGILQRHVAPARVVMVAAVGPPRTSEELEERYRAMDEARAKLRSLLQISWLICGIAVLWSCVMILNAPNRDWVKLAMAGSVGGLYCVLAWGLYFHAKCQFRKSLSELATYRTALTARAPAGEPVKRMDR